MPKLKSPIYRFYDQLILSHPRKVIACLLIIIAILGFFAKDFRIDASADTLVNETSDDIQFAWKIYNRYGVQDFLFIAYTPKNADLLSDAVLKDIANLKKELSEIPRVVSVVTLLDAPLLESPPVAISEMTGDLPTLRSERVNKEMAREELKTSPIYRNLLVSPDLKTTGIQVTFEEDTHYRDLVVRRIELEKKADEQGLSAAEQAEYSRIIEEIRHLRDQFNAQRDADINQIREIMKKYEGGGELFLGGVSMIAHDLIRFIKNDLKVFGLGVVCLLIVVLGIIFRRLRWVILPMLCCGFSTIAMAGLLGLFGWQVTVISSNFISLQLIITMAISVHLIVRYRELLCQNPDEDHRQLVLETMRLKLTPIFYAALTSGAGFASLMLANIKPVITFGWMMVGGIVVSLLITVLFLPAVLVLLKKTQPPPVCGGSIFLTTFLSGFTEKWGRLILIISVLVLLVSGVGMSRLEVENSFVNYFKKSTEIYKGMKVIDQKLGGTTPLDVVIDLGGAGQTEGEANSPDADDTAGDFDMFSEFDAPDSGNQYWFTPYKMQKILEIHNYLDSLPETGKVLSLGTLMQVARDLNKGRSLDSFELSLVYNEIPEKFRKDLVKPFVSIEHDQIRFMVRVQDTNPTLRRNELINGIKHDLTHRFGYDSKDVRLTGLLVLYNNVLQTLFETQILTLGVVLLALMLMFFMLFNSIKVALIAVFPNIIAVSVVLGVMGWAGIPLDIMTITIAAISVGIAVDDTIHYIHRFKKEIRVDWDYIAAMHRCHGSIGYAMYYTTIVIILGFSILALSNFIPTIIFGLMTGVAMLIALLASLTLLPRLLIIFKPWRQDRKPRQG
ncbi:MAG TPA: MMPL family transporter [Desulfosalsimonadaceae bacterium]|nr:MMPL family transporter [Desulfosalsimonadaceae bacterium]